MWNQISFLTFNPILSPGNSRYDLKIAIPILIPMVQPVFNVDLNKRQEDCFLLTAAFLTALQTFGEGLVCLLVSCLKNYIGSPKDKRYAAAPSCREDASMHIELTTKNTSHQVKSGIPAKRRNRYFLTLICCRQGVCCLRDEY